MKQVKYCVVWVVLMISGLTSLGQTCPSTSRNPWEWPGHNNWYFGNGNFYNQSTGVITTSNSYASYEGITAASDDAGNLVFFSNGRNLWDAGGTLKSSALLTGNEGGAVGMKGSSAQGNMTVRHPLNPNKYYVLTVDDALGPTMGLNYFEVDQNGNVGATGRLGNFRTTEGVTATLHDNGVDVWVVVMEANSTNYHAFLLECEGFDPNPVTSGGGVSVSGARERGGIALSWDGKKFLQGHPDYWPNSGKELQLYDFDNATGQITGGMDISPTNSAENPYDVIFSPDNQRIYWTSGGNGQLWTMDISSGVAGTIEGSIQNTGVSLGSFASIAMGADGNLYMSSSGQGFKRITGNINAGTGLSASAQLAPGNLGMPTIYIPPAEEPDIDEVGPFCDNDGPVDLSTTWLCSKVDAEDADNPDAYQGNGITDNTWGTFDPSTAGPGLHEIIFTYCAVDDTIWIQVDECTGCTVSLMDTEPEICVGEMVLLDTMVLAGSGPGEWTIDSFPANPHNAQIPIAGGDTSFDASNLATEPGVYKLMYTVTDGANTCEDSVYITVNPLPTVDLGQDVIVCPGDSNEFDAGVFDTYRWYINGSGANQSYMAKVEGDYAVEVTDANGCMDADTANFSFHTPPNVDLGPDVDVCPGDSNEFDAGAFTSYQWSINGAGTDQTFMAKIAGDYAVIVTDANGCSDSDTVALGFHVAPVVDLGPDVTVCPGDSNEFDAGAFTSYQWSINGSGTDQTFMAKVAGDYAVIVTDANGCSDSDTVALGLHVAPVVDLGPDVTVCPGDSSEFDAGVFDSYAWSLNGSGTDQTFVAKTVGDYEVIVTDANGCKDTDVVALLFHAKPVVDLGNDIIVCPGDSTEFDAGAFPVYRWMDNGSGVDQTFMAKVAGDYTVEVTDANGCKDTNTVALSFHAKPNVDLGPDRLICPGAPEEEFDAGAFDTYQWFVDGNGATQTYSTDDAGDYAVIVTDANGCSDTDTVSLGIHPKPVVDLGPDRTICENAADEVFDAGVFATYTWGGDAAGASQTYETNTAGTFTVIIEDVNSCSDSDTVVLNVIPLPEPDVIADVTICPGMNQTFEVNTFNNGNGAYTYSWQDGSTASNINVGAQGWYWVDITDSYGCVGRDSAYLTIQNNLNVSIFSAPEIQLCAGEDTILRTNYNAVDGYNFNWTGLVNSNNETVNTIQVSGKYIVEVDNGQGCDGTAEIDVIINPLPAPEPYDTSFCENGNVNIGLGMGAGYDYAWNNGEVTENINVTSANIVSPYNVTITDKTTGCEASAVINVTEHLNPIVNVEDVTVCEEIPVVLQSTENYNNVTYLWTGGTTDPTLSPTTGGDYTLSVTSQFGCMGSDVATVVFNPIPTVDLGPDTVTICEGENHTFDAGNDGADILWNNGETTSEVNGIATYQYIVTVTDAGCPAKDTVQLIVVPLPASELDQSIAAQKYCFEEMDRPIGLVANDDPSYDYLWNTGETTNEIQVSEAGTYSVSISAGGCSVSDLIVIEEFCPWTIFIPNAFTPDGDGVNDYFNAAGTNIIDFRLLIYNRWGERIYETTSLNEPWDGTFKGREVQIDVYVYKMYFSYEEESGAIMNDQKVGTVTVVR